MQMQQISIFLENISGRLADVTQILADHGINLRAMTIADTNDFGILRIIVDQTDKAVETLRTGGFTAMLTDVLALEIPDSPGALARVMAVFRQTGVNIEYLYASLEQNSSKAVVILKVGDLAHGLAIVKEHKLSQVEVL